MGGLVKGIYGTIKTFQPMNGTEHIFFDLDHTLWDFEANSDDAYRQVLKETGINVDFEVFSTTYHPINQACWEDYAAGKVTKEQVKYNRLRKTLEALHIRVDDATARQMAGRYLELLARGTKMFPGTFEILDYLRPKYQLHLLTNGFAEVQWPKIKASGLTEYFDTITLSEETGLLKPHPEVFRHALQKAGAFAHQSVMIGDNFKGDIVGARNVGMKAVLFDPDGRYDIPETLAPTVRHLTELKNLF